ncbi:AraC family transcriptional regulator [Chitinophaga niastensis]|uniref:AraC family transcriptional regulator n=1 Tax=Chitinophaga niastensis TaxID=536980 RepID=A0A2P8HQ47_CHINA|nr:AraC family transcriptional regulator [Chitinophaga niastensis]PSL48326.1 AraC family transcriptional regulator [Chitinophaga niastensis]
MITLETAIYLGTNTSSFSAGGVVVSETEYQQQVSEDWHCHENHHITFIARGGNLEQRTHKEYSVQPGDVLLYNSGEIHRNRNTQLPSLNINVEIGDTFLKQYELDFNQASAGHPDLKLAMLRIRNESKIGDSSSVVAIQQLLLQAFSAEVTGKTRVIPAWVHQLRELLHDRWKENLTLDELSAILQLHPVSISRYFPHYFHCTLGVYIRKLKVERALSLMKQSHHSLTDIAYTCGFFDQSHFIRAFKSYTGFRPGDYMKL